jgi:hypothetical protein
MSPSLQALLTRIIDYAGLFPPARLPLAEAIHNYARYRNEPDAWMLGRFICPAARLAELTALHPNLHEGPPLVFAALGRGGAATTEFLAGLEADLDAIDAFRAHHGERVLVDALEVRLPAEVLQPPHQEAVLGLLCSVAEMIYEVQRPSFSGTFFEAALGADWRATLSAVAAAVAEDNRLGTHSAHWIGGIKLRCGGTTAADFPSPEQVAFAITACRDAGVPLKFTAGLHHPFRHFDPSLQTPLHGFLNVFVAGVLAATLRLSEERVREILADEDAGHFAFDATGLSWKELRATTEEIATARRHLVLSFGSCSFDEPCADLRALGLLPSA